MRLPKGGQAGNLPSQTTRLPPTCHREIDL